MKNYLIVSRVEIAIIVLRCRCQRHPLEKPRSTLLGGVFRWWQRRQESRRQAFAPHPNQAQRGRLSGRPAGYEILICFERESVVKYNHDAAGHGVMNTPDPVRWAPSDGVSFVPV